MAQPQMKFELLEMVVAHGQKRLESMFRATFEDLEQLKAQGLSPAQLADCEQLEEAYRLAQELIETMLQFKSAMQQSHATR